MKSNPIELLSPCGSPDALRAALRGGADAVYLGGTMLNARMKAKNFDDGAMRDAVRDCHRAGVRLYVTMNTLVYDREMDAALRYAAKLYEEGVDALIVADMGFARALREFLPGMPLHASTQAGVHNTDAVRYLAQNGFCRAVCARELSGEAIARLAQDAPIGIEMFIHGAMCVCHSGQCLFSSMAGGRSGNRGECAQPCRMAYNHGEYPLSLKDMCLAGHMRQILHSGVESLKIEGRMKSPDYVYAVTKAYRRLIDEERDATPAEIRSLAEIFSRSGFSDGYYTRNIGPSMLGVRREADVEATRRTAVKQETVTRSLPPVAVERTAPVLPERKEIAAFVNGAEKRCGGKRTRSARFEYASQIAGRGFFDLIYLPLERFVPGAADGVILDPVLTDADMPRAEEMLRRAAEGGARHVLISNIGQLPSAMAWAQTWNLTLHGDFRLNITNNLSARLYGLRDVMLSPEMTLPQIRDIRAPKSVIVYGRIPLMVLEKPLDVNQLRDRTRAVFPVVHGRNGERDRIFNSVITYMEDRLEKLDGLGISDLHYLFSTESPREAEMAVERLKRGIEPKDPVRRIK